MLVNVVGGRSADSNQRIMYSTTCMANEFKMLNIMRRIMRKKDQAKYIGQEYGTEKRESIGSLHNTMIKA